MTSNNIKINALYIFRETASEVTATHINCNIYGLALCRNTAIFIETFVPDLHC